MIVRVSGEGQYRLDHTNGELNQLDNAVVSAVERATRARTAPLRRALGFVRSSGEPVGDDQLFGSDLILPLLDLSLEEAAVEFHGEGLIPDRGWSLPVRSSRCVATARASISRGDPRSRPCRGS